MIQMKRPSLLLLAPALLLAWSLGLAGSAAAQANADPEIVDRAKEVLAEATPESVGEEAAQVFGRLQTSYFEAQDYQQRLENSNAEDSLVLQLQLEKSRDRFLAALHELADLVVDQDSGGAPNDLRAKGEAVIAAVTPGLLKLIEELRGQIDETRSKRLETPAAERSALEDDITNLTRRLDNYLNITWENLQKLETLGQDTSQTRAVFSQILLARSDELSGRLDLALARIAELKARQSETPDDADLAALLTANRKNLASNAESQGVVLDLMEAADLPTTEHRAQLITATQDLSSGLLDAKAAATLLDRGWNNFLGWLVESGPSLLVQLLLFLVIIVAGRFLARLVRSAVEQSLIRANADISQLLRRMIVNGAHNAVVGLAILVAMSQLGISLGPLLAGLGVVGFILGFAMQDSLSNLAAGMMILINRPYDVGDLVEISGVFGKVENMSMVSTSVLTLDNQKLVVPNSKIWGDVIKNVTDQRIRRVDMVFGISYSDDIPNAERVLNEILNQNDLVLDDPEPMVRVHTLGESSVDFVVRPWVKTDDYWDVHWAVTKTVKMRFDEEGISIPFPQRDVHLFQTAPAHHGEVSTEASRPSPSGAQDPDEIAGDEG